MTERLQIYKCEVCGNIVEMIHGGKGELICCNEPMKLFKEMPPFQLGAGILEMPLQIICKTQLINMLQ